MSTPEEVAAYQSGIGDAVKIVESEMAPPGQLDSVEQFNEQSRLMRIKEAIYQLPVPEVIEAQLVNGMLTRPKHGWTCFFCGETFMTPGAARDHFGADPLSTPGCQIKAGAERGLLMALREAEAELAKYRADDTDLIRENNGLKAEIIATERKAEEAGYARALSDIEAGKIEPEHAARILTALLDLPMMDEMSVLDRCGTALSIARWKHLMLHDQVRAVLDVLRSLSKDNVS